MRRDIGLLHDPNRKPVKLNSLMSNFADQAGDFIGDSLSGMWRGLLDVDPELQARRDAEAKALYDARAESPFFQMFGWGEGNDDREGNALQNFLPSLGGMYRDTAQAIRNPAPTTEAITNLVAGGVLNLTPVGDMLGEDVGQAQRQMASEFGNYLKTSYGTWEGFKEEFRKNPAEVLSMIAGAGFTVKGVADVATNPAVQQRFMAEMDGMVNAANAGFMTPLTVWHGSPYNFTRFSTDKMGSGEGVQAYGWGIYHAEAKDTAKTYEIKEGVNDKAYEAYEEEMLSRMNKALDERDYMKAEMYEMAALHRSPEFSLEDMLDAYKDKPELHDKIKADHSEWQKHFEKQPFGRYKVDLPDQAIATMLNDDIPIYDQPKVVQDFLRKEHGAYMDLVDKYKPLQLEREAIQKQLNEAINDNEVAGILGGEPINTDRLMVERDAIIAKQDEILKEIGSLGRGTAPHPSNGSGIYGYLVEREIIERGIPASELEMSRFGVRNNAVEKIISERLHANGIMGRQYFDADSRDLPDTERKTRNFVTFSADTSKILENKGVPIDNTKRDVSSIPIGDVDIRYSGGKDKNSARVGDLANIKGGILDQYGRTVVGENLVSAPSKSIQDYEGRPFVASQSDTTKAGGMLTHVDGQPLNEPVELLGGQDYMFLPESQRQGLLWASAEEPIDKLIYQAQEAKKAFGEDPIYLPFAMKPTGMDFSKQVTNTMMQSALAKLDSKQLDELDRLIRTTSKDKETGKEVNLDWKGIRSENPLENTTGGERKEINRIIDVHFRAKGNKDGTISLPQARLANVDEFQYNKEPLTIRNVGEVNMSEMKSDVSGHPTYPYALRGEGQARIKEDLSILDLFDNTKAKDSKGRELPMTRENFTDKDYRKTTMQYPPIGLLTHERLMKLEKQGLL